MLSSSRLVCCSAPFLNTEDNGLAATRSESWVAAIGWVCAWPPENRYWPPYWVFRAPTALDKAPCRVVIRSSPLLLASASATAFLAFWLEVATVVSAWSCTPSLPESAWALSTYWFSREDRLFTAVSAPAEVP